MVFCRLMAFGQEIKCARCHWLISVMWIFRYIELNGEITVTISERLLISHYEFPFEWSFARELVCSSVEFMKIFQGKTQHIWNEKCLCTVHLCGILPCAWCYEYLIATTTKQGQFVISFTGFAIKTICIHCDSKLACISKAILHRILKLKLGSWCKITNSIFEIELLEYFCVTS